MFTRTQFRPFLTWPLHCNILLSIQCPYSAQVLRVMVINWISPHNHVFLLIGISVIKHVLYMYGITVTQLLYDFPLTWIPTHSTDATAIRRAFDWQRSLRLQWRWAADSLVALTLTSLNPLTGMFIRYTQVGLCGGYNTCDSTAIWPLLYSYSTAIRSHYDHSTAFVTTVDRNFHWVI